VSNLIVETPEPMTKHSQRSSSARKKANNKLEEENGESTSQNEVVVLDDDADFEEDDDYEEDDDELDYKETTMRRGQKLTRKAMSTKARANDKGPVDVDLTNNNDDDSLSWI
jgi:hypothetical protein